MARVSNWNPTKHNEALINASMKRLRKAAEVVAENVRSRCPVGTISRPIYKTGPYAGAKWTARDAGALKRSIRVVEKRGATAIDLFTGSKQKNIRIYAGNFLAYYAKIVEYSGKKFMRPGLNASKNQVRSILENG